LARPAGGRYLAPPGDQPGDQPGAGVEVQPLKSSIAEETFQTLLVMKALEELGYDVEDIKEIEYAAGHVAVANGDATFMADHWNPLHVDFYARPAVTRSSIARASTRPARCKAT
jgi:glycine betaine/proline transport system substrate-binding protein